MDITSQYLPYSAILLFSFLITTTSAIIQSPPNIVKEPSADELLFQVATDQYDNDKPFIIDCEAKGEPAPKYRWMKNGKKFDWQVYDDRIAQQPGSGSLIVTKPRDEDLGQYQCFAENTWGIATSKSVMVMKAELNSFDSEQNLHHINVQEGEPFKLTCHSPTGWPKPTVIWLIKIKDGTMTTVDNRRMTIDPEGNLWFSNVTQYDASPAYYCYAESFIMSTYKLGDPVKLNVIQNIETFVRNKYPPIQQYVTRRNEVALLNKKVELFCIYGGTPLPQTIWFKDGIAISLNERITLDNYGKSLTIWKVNFKDEGKYTCEVSNGVGLPQSYNIVLDVMAVPIFTVIPQIVEGGEGETAVIKCEASGKPRPSIKWIHNGRPLTEASFNPRRFVSSNSITITSLTKHDTGNYGCNATNSFGYVYKDVYINVLALAPEITEPLPNVKTVDGSTTTVIRCKPLGIPKPHVKWTRNNIELTGGRYSTLDSGDLQISKVSFTDAGIYTCIATNNYGMANASGTLTVKEHTEIVTEPEDNVVVAGSVAIFHCTATADHSLHLKIDWLANDEPIDYDTQPRFVKTNDHSMIITKAIELDSGIYTCLAKTELDQVSANAILIVQDKPNPPSLLEINCNQRNAMVKWRSNGDNRAPILYYTIEYSTSFDPDTWLVASDNVPASKTKLIVPMTPWANFTFRVIAKNNIGKSNPSLYSSVCTTQPDVPYTNPENIEVYGTKPSNLVISWAAMPKIYHNAPGLRYRVYWKQDIPGQVWNFEEITDYTKKELVILNQPMYKHYKVKIVASNEKGESNGLQKEVIGYSWEDVPVDAPQNLTVLNVTGSKSAILSWEPVSAESVKGNLKGYKIQFWSDRDEENNKIEETISVDKTTVEIKNFFPNAKNHVLIFAYNSYFNGPHSKTIFFYTPEGVPGPVHGVKSEQWGSSAILLSWQPPDEANGVLTGYEISYESITQRGVGERAHHPSITNPKHITTKLAALKPSTNYRIYIQATTKAGVGEPFFIEQRTKSPLPIGTELDKPQFNYVHKAHNKVFDTVRIFWTPNLNGNPGSHFFVKYKLEGDYLYEETKHELVKNFIDVKGLKPEKLYEFIVVVVDGNNIKESDIVVIEASSNVADLNTFNELEKHKIMKKASFGRRSSAAGRNTFGGSTFGRQNSFDGNDMRLSRRESRGMEKKSMLLKPGFSAKKKSASSDNLSAHDPKQWSSTVKKPANQQRNTLVRSTTSMNITGINLVASTPCVTPGLNPNLPGINSSYKNRRLSSESRYSNYGGVLKNRKEVRPLTEKDFQQTAIHKIQNYFLTAPNACHILNNGSMKPMTTTMFTDMCEYLLHKLDRNQVLNKSKYMEELPKIMKKYYYKGKVDKSWLITVNASHSFPQVVGLLLWLVELCETQNRFNVMDTLYPTILDPDESEDEDYEQTVEFKMYLPFLLNSYQVETRGSGKPSDQEFLKKQEELLLDNYKKTLGVDEEALIKLEAEVENHKMELDLLNDLTEEQKLEEMKAMKVALQKDILNSKKYIKDLQTCHGEVQEYISKKKDERVFQEKDIENLQRELNAVNSCINGQQITQDDKKIIEEDIINLRQDIQYETNCLEEYSNIVYSEDLNVVDVRLKLDKLFVQYNKLCAENIVVLPELENAIADKNVLALHIRESLKEVDELLKSLKNKNVEKLKEVEHKIASIRIELDSTELEYSKLKKIAEKLDPERDADKKRLLEITDRQFEAKQEHENRLYEIQAEMKSINLDNTEVKVKTEEKNNLCQQISEMEEEKKYILTKTSNSLKKHVELIEETKELVKNLSDQQLQNMQSIKSNYV